MVSRNPCPNNTRGSTGPKKDARYLCVTIDVVKLFQYSTRTTKNATIVVKSQLSTRTGKNFFGRRLLIECSGLSCVSKFCTLLHSSTGISVEFGDLYQTRSEADCTVAEPTAPAQKGRRGA